MAEAYHINFRRNVIAGFAAGYFCVAFISLLALTQYWIASAPKTPAARLGAVFAHNEKGAISYFTEFQATACTLLSWSCMASVLLALCIQPKRNVRVIDKRGFWMGSRWQTDDPNNAGKKGVGPGVVFGIVAIYLIGPYLIGWLNSLGVVLNL